MERYDIIVAGAGAAGLLAAGRAGELGARVLLIEHKSKPGRKLAISGKGRCNLTNDTHLSDFINHFHPNGRFLRNSFSHFFNRQLIELMAALNVETVTERGGRVFPKNGSAPKVVEALVKWNQKNKVEIKTNSKVLDILQEDECVQGVKVCNVSHKKSNIVVDKVNQQVLHCEGLILATGGVSYPATGSTGDGYILAQKVGHQIISPRPALVPLDVQESNLEQLEGLVLKNIEISLWVDGKKESSLFGEMTFTKTGLGGPVILTISHKVVDFLQEKRQVMLKLDMKPALDHPKLDNRLLRDLKTHHLKSFQHILKGLLPQQLIPYCSQQTDIPLDKKANQISAKERKTLRLWLKEKSFEITGYRPFSEAIVTAGGVKLNEVNPKTMESKILQGLYFAGEILDIQADTGGYNLQAAFSTGYLAAESAFSACKPKT